MEENGLTYLWSHDPEVSAEPEEEIARCLIFGTDDKVDEFGVFKLTNSRYLYISFHSTLKDLTLGVTDIEEFETEAEALEVYDKFVS